MKDLNVEVPESFLDRVRMAKIMTKTPIRDIVMESVEAWLRANAPSVSIPDPNNPSPKPPAKPKK